MVLGRPASHRLCRHGLLLGLGARVAVYWRVWKAITTETQRSQRKNLCVLCASVVGWVFRHSIRNGIHQSRSSKEQTVAAIDPPITALPATSEIQCIPRTTRDARTNGTSKAHT